MAAEIIPTTTGVVIKMQAPQAPQMSVSASSNLTNGASTTTSSTKMSMSTSTSSSTKTTSTTKITKKTSYSSKTSSSSTITQGGNSTTSSTFKTIKTSSNSGSFSDDIASMFGINADQEMEKMKSIMSDQMSRMKSERFSLQSTTSSTSSSGPDSSLVQFDPKSIMDFAENDNLRFNFDMSNFASETVNVKTVGNKIEVHAQRKTKTADGETSEEYSRSYEMPTSQVITPEKVTSSLYKEGVLTISLPVSEAMQGVEL
ncbi:hypothetical protein CAPTEDRAFT_171595 [Capitella teleta]|uniref:SHSP domain-containing protein n=1 Tax=Capitella teleta TaxID=283909 RepID=R7UDS4_CAPTE|nr:hypothetical protein CAPTEDRAFT_171595 [Capitella teleta]|eukprot:ELU04261.1 hypothetical protein CAPTEDRAFT_171595 [Capitella teleta]